MTTTPVINVKINKTPVSSSYLRYLLDVDTTGKSNNDILYYNQATGKFQFRAEAGGSADVGAAFAQANSAFVEANTANTLAATANTLATSANTLAATANTLATTANTKATAANTLAASANVLATSANTLATSANTLANAANVLATSANTLAGSANTLATSANTLATTANSILGLGYIAANIAFAQANAAFAQANAGGGITGLSYSNGVFHIGSANSSSPISQYVTIPNVSNGTIDVAGVNWYFNGSQGTGAGAGGDIVFQTSSAGTSGNTQNPLAEVFRVTNDKKLKFTGTGIDFTSSGGTYGAVNLSILNPGSFNFSAIGPLQLTTTSDYVHLSGLQVWFHVSGNVWTISGNPVSVLTGPTQSQILVDTFQLRPLTIATLPTPAAGMKAYVTDGTAGLTWGQTLSGGGGGDHTHYFVACKDGSTWIVIG